MDVRHLGVCDMCGYTCAGYHILVIVVYHMLPGALVSYGISTHLCICFYLN